MDISEIAASVKALPTIPVVASKILRLSENEDSTVEEMVKTIQLDPSVAARILKAANSAYYSCPRTVTTVKSAIILVGFNTVRAISVAASVKELYNPFGLTEKLLWDHSIFTAHVCQELATTGRCTNKDEAFMAGLFHDIGLAIMNQAEPARFSKLVSEAWNSGSTVQELESAFFSYSHTDLGALVLKKWALPENLVTCAQFHHAPEGAAGSGDDSHRLAVLVSIADAIVRTPHGETVQIAAGAEKALQLVGIGRDDIAELAGRFNEHKDEIAASYCD